MTARRSLRLRLRHVLVPILGAGVVGYFLWHLVEGERGLRQLAKVEKRLTVREAELKRLTAAEAAIQARVKGLRPDALDLDLLDERARAVLGYSHPDDLILRDKPAAPAAP